MKPFEEQRPEDSLPEHSANPGYALGQLAAAFTTNRQHPDAETRTAAYRATAYWHSCAASAAHRVSTPCSRKKASAVRASSAAEASPRRARNCARRTYAIIRTCL